MNYWILALTVTCFVICMINFKILLNEVDRKDKNGCIAVGIILIMNIIGMYFNAYEFFKTLGL